MGKNWAWERRHDYYYKKAKKEGYRSRASYKLIQINSKYHILPPGGVIVELGSSPGGWTQVAAKMCGAAGTVIAVDIASMKPIDGVSFIKGDMTDPDTIDRILEIMKTKGLTQADSVISDMSPNISGNYTWDQARSVDLARKALHVADLILKDGGSFLVKVFAGMDFNDFLKDVRDRFEFVKIQHPAASRSSSSEVYVVALRYHKKEYED